MSRSGPDRQAKDMKLLVRGWIGAAAVGLVVLSSPVHAGASCAALGTSLAEAVGESPVVFVATVVSTSNGDREAVMNIVSVWRGSDLPAQVRVIGTPETGAAATSVDRKYAVGHTYLVLPVNQSSPFQDNACTQTQEYTSDMANLAPASAKTYPQPGPPPPLALSPWWIGASVVVLAGAGAVALRWRAKRA